MSTFDCTLRMLCLQIKYELVYNKLKELLNEKNELVNKLNRLEVL